MPAGPASHGQSGQASDSAAPLRRDKDRFRVFVSYSRADSQFADEIEAGLEYDGGFDVLIDRHDIHEGEDWKARLGALIAQADTVVFILTRKSAASPICRWEVEHASGLSKRIVPVQAETLGDLEPPPVLAALNYVRFDEGRSFMAGLTGLRRALKTDLDWLREHTRLLMRAQEWQAADNANNRLLSGSDIVAAKAWLDQSPADGLQPTELHRDFIQASDHAETLRLSAERERAESLERAVKRARTALRRVVLLACVAGVAAGIALWQWSVAERARSAAQAATAEAREATVEAEAAGARAQLESERADRFVNLVSSDEAGRQAMKKTCLEAIHVTSMLASTTDARAWRQARERFFELYYSSMYIVELHQRKASDMDVSSIEANMVGFRKLLLSLESSKTPLPHKSLCANADGVRDGCVSHLGVTAAGRCH